jgi:hypothetical protein
MKKGITFLMTVVLALMMTGCAASFIVSSGGRDGSTFDRAVIVGSVRAEYLYIDRTFNGASIMTQVMKEHNGRPYDIVTIRSEEGIEQDVYFDISKFYRKKTYADDLE